MIRILTDSVSNIPKELLQQYNIKVLPLRVHFGEAETYLDFDFEHDQIFKMIEEKPIFPNTTAPTINDFDQAFAELTQETDQILVVCFSSGMSSTYQAAVLAAENYKDKANIRIVDSKAVTLGFGLLVIEAARMIENGATLDEVQERLEERKRKLNHLMIIDNLDYLRRGGRVSSAAAIAGGMLNIKPVLHVDEEGKLAILTKVRGKKKAIQYVLDYMGSKDLDLSIMAVNHALSYENADELQAAVEERFHPKEIIRYHSGNVVAIHAGPGCFGVYFFEK